MPNGRLIIGRKTRRGLGEIHEREPVSKINSVGFKVDLQKFKVGFRRPLLPLLMFLELNMSIFHENKQ